jgi:hypothetical protein
MDQVGLHRFIGIFHEDGIAELSVSNIAQLDHLQYGYAIPEPDIVVLFPLAGVILFRRRRK